MDKRIFCWMRLPGWQTREDTTSRLSLFRGRLLLAVKPDHAPIQITADSRYKLYVNGAFVEAGPACGDGKVWYVDTVDIAPYLCSGENILAVAVLRYPAAHGAGCHGVVRTGTAGLYVDAELPLEWKCRLHGGFEIVPENPWFSPLMIYERGTAEGALAGWREAGYDDSGWAAPVSYSQNELTPILCPDRLVPRPIPFLYRAKRQFTGISKGTGQWDALVRESKPLTIPAHTTACADLDAGELTTGYLRVSMAGGAGAKLTLLQAECYAGNIVPKDDPYKSLPRKGDRTDAALQLHGYIDEYHATGYGTADRPECYEPYWFRAFRFIRVAVETGDEPLTLFGVDYEETGYPLQMRAKVKTSDPSLDAVWELCERSLRRCMHETYEDCPFYERLQYAMDGRSEMLYTYAVSGDDRLALKCMDDFAASIRSDGMVNCSAPNYETNVIPGFGIYFIGMVYDHMWWFGDAERTGRYWFAVERVLSFFECRLNERGLVSKIGDVNRPGQFWSFIDWTAGWDATDGVPPATKQGSITMESLLYILGLQYAAELADFLAHSEQARKYRTQAAHVHRKLSWKCHLSKPTGFLWMKTAGIRTVLGSHSTASTARCLRCSRILPPRNRDVKICSARWNTRSSLSSAAWLCAGICSGLWRNPGYTTMPMACGTPGAKCPHSTSLPARRIPCSAAATATAGAPWLCTNCLRQCWASDPGDRGSRKLSCLPEQKTWTGQREAFPPPKGTCPYPGTRTEMER